uniref:acyltransferase family protein n=1 Tax=Chitinimonas sp. TaxID=1934313 RepID=UPI0035B480ED
NHPWLHSLLAPGYKAVDIFFILSGLILAVVYRDLRWTPAPRFMLRRVFRVYPLHIVALVVLILAVSWPAFLPGYFVSPAFGASVLIVQPYWPSQAAQNPPAWSIGVEMLCYLLFPAAMALLRSIGQRRHALYSLVAVLALVQLWVQFHYLGITTGIGAIVRGLAGFSLGMAIARLAGQLTLSARWASRIELLACAGIAMAICLKQEHWIASWAALLLFCLYFDQGVVAQQLRKPLWLWLGNISFSVYLIHYPLLMVAKKMPWLEGLLHGGFAGKLAYYALLTGALLLISSLSYRYLEQPCRKIPDWLLGRANRQQQAAAG